MDEIILLLQNDSAGDGIDFSSIILQLRNKFSAWIKVKSVKEFESMVDDVLFELAYDGRVFQPRPNYYKFMD